MNAEFPELQLFSRSQAAKYLSIGKEKLAALIHSGKLGFIDIDGSIKIPYIEIVRFLKENLRYEQVRSSNNISEKPELHPELSDEFDSAKIFNELKEGVL